MDEFDAVLELYQRRSEARRDAAQAKVEQQAALRTECAGPLLALVPPVLEAVAGKLRAHGHRAEMKTSTKPWASAMLSLELAGRSAQASTLLFDCLAGDSIRCSREIWGPKSARSSEEVALSSLTAERVRGMALRFVSQVLDQW